MAHIITMPRFGATMEEGTINSWFVKEGDSVVQGDVLGEIEIEKLSNELLAEVDGVVLKILADEGETLACGAPILILGDPGEGLDDLDSPVGAAEAGGEVPEAPGVPSAAPALAAAAPTGEYRAAARITPKGLALAEELGVDYHTLQGTGRMGMITREDIRAAIDAGTAPMAGAPAVPEAAPAPAPVPHPGEAQKMNAMQAALARAMDASLKSTAQTTISMDVDVDALVAAYRAHKDAYRQQGVNLTYTAILIKAVALALVAHPILRTVIEAGSLVTRSEINVGVAIDIPDGLVVPNIKGADAKSVRQIAIELADLGERARANRLKPQDVSGGVFTLTNLGAFGIKYFTPILNPGESGILGVGVIQEVPYVRGGGIFIKSVMNLSLTHDHRVVNGAPGARFLQTIAQQLGACADFFTPQENQHDQR